MQNVGSVSNSMPGKRVRTGMVRENSNSPLLNLKAARRRKSASRSTSCTPSSAAGVGRAREAAAAGKGTSCTM